MNKWGKVRARCTASLIGTPPSPLPRSASPAQPQRKIQYMYKYMKKEHALTSTIRQ